jgi:hypothetical protein
MGGYARAARRHVSLVLEEVAAGSVLEGVDTSGSGSGLGVRHGSGGVGSRARGAKGARGGIAGNQQVKQGLRRIVLSAHKLLIDPR